MSSEARGLSNVTKVLEGAGTVLGVVSALNDANEIYNKGMSNATVADWSKLGVSVGQLALKSNPWTIGLGLAYGVADMTGYNPIDLVYDRVKK
ncbi:hypothetical protein [Pedobacter sp. PACM 27299]|uniref:hypothetical protein n=1 Tax=Pedobacter sp. PACM 27299 TaxID=1727164 RepID=UPI000B30CAAF|nr:hypothetical protein [Pedobacter sp. PACM 27299]